MSDTLSLTPTDERTTNMLENAPVKTYVHDKLTIEGYSRAAVQTYWRIPEMKLGFDLGLQPWEFMGTNTWLISHSHLDHIAALPVLVARRRMMKMDPPTIYLPEQAVGGVDSLIFIKNGSKLPDPGSTSIFDECFAFWC